MVAHLPFVSQVISEAGKFVPNSGRIANTSTEKIKKPATRHQVVSLTMITKFRCEYY
jgi:hypothetical protein